MASGDQIRIDKLGQAASVGSHNIVTDTHMEQANTESALAGVDMSALAEQLDILTTKLKAAATEPDQYTALAEVSQAAKSAKEKDREGTLQHLKKAGGWVLGIAQSVGVELAVGALKAAIGLPPA